MAKKTRKSNPASAPLSTDEYIAIFGVVVVLVCVVIYFYKRYRASRRYKQTNPYVATVDLQERYGGLEKRQVSIDDLSTETLVLLQRDGKLNPSTILRLRREGRLPDPDAPKETSSTKKKGKQKI